MLQTTMKRLPNSKKSQGWLRGHFEDLRLLRNRVTHHEPIFDRDDLAELHSVGWQTAWELEPFFCSVLRPACRFSLVTVGKLGVEREELKAQIRSEIYEKYRVPSPGT